MRKNRFFLWTSVLTLSLVLAACGPDREEEAAGTSDGNGEAESDKPETLTMWVNDEEGHLAAYEELGERFTEEHDIDVEITPFSMLDQLESLSLDAASGGGPDLFFQPNDPMGDIYLQGLAAELDLTDEELEGYNENAVEALNYEGVQLGVPVAVETYALYYNTELVPEAPETFEDIEEIAADLTDASSDEYGFLMEGTNFYYLYAFLAGNGGYVFNQDEEGVYDTEDIGLNNEGAVEAAELVQGWFEEGYLPTGITGDIMEGLFSEGNVGAVISGPWNLGPFQEALGDNLGVAPLPTFNGENLESFSTVKGWLVNEYSENQEWAKELALFVTNQENSETFYELTEEVPARTDIEITDEMQEGFTEQAEHAVAMPNIPEMSTVWEPMEDAFIFISEGTDPQEALDGAVDQIRDDMEMMGSGQ
ncbi:sugar ABC transporter substrate-binding protein [Shouchella shacheensis]|uniref:sugar ABC transporter substrate-binding protein n=1 Tax=Shouchella shacheensis TaxID=1649580 RepID=UPI00073FDD83|nr:extracellular solute-binding protein [Shouchella shacheensis]